MKPVPSPQHARLLDLLVDTICVVDRGGHYVYVSAAIESLLGYRREELIGRNMIDLVAPEDRERTLRAAEEIMRGQPRLNFENRYVRKDGRSVYLLWSARWSEPDGVRIAVARDVTGLKTSSRLQEAVYGIAGAVHATEGLEDLCRQIHEILRCLLPAENFIVALCDGADRRPIYPYVLDAEASREASPVKGGYDGLVADVLDAKRPGLDPKGRWLGAPLDTGSRVLGAMLARSPEPEAPCTEDHQDLFACLSGHVARALDRKQAEIRLRHLADHDPLTDLPNRSLFDDRFEMALKRARRRQERLALLYLDLDGFKQINDCYGHDAGDQLLKELARRLAGCVRETDILGRRGGDEFTVLLTDVLGPDSVEVALGKIRSAIDAPYEIEGRRLAVRASIGKALYPEHGTGREQLLRRADAGMYASKRRAG